MNETLFVAGSVTELRRLTPFHTALAKAGANPRLHWFGPAQPFPTGLPQPDHTVEATGDDALASFTNAAAAKFREAPPQFCFVAGNSLAAQAATAAATAAGIKVARVNAGCRSHHRDDADETRRRSLDHAGSVWFAATSHQQLNLVREGLPQDAVHVVGSPLSTTFHDDGADNSKTVVIAFQNNWNDVRTTVTTVANKHNANVADAQPDFANLVGARAVVTDVPAVQEAACAFGVPCVTVSDYTTHPETVDCAANQVAGSDTTSVARALEIALQNQNSWQLPYTPWDAAAVTEVLTGLFQSKQTNNEESANNNGQIALPSDGDASGRTLGQEEIDLVSRAICSGTLNSTKGTFVSQFENEFAAATGAKHAIACANGSAAVHCAINAMELSAGDEVITTPITDMGALTCILYEGAIPVFADVDENTLNVTAETIKAQITDRTKAIIVTHLFGLSCDMEPIVELANSHNIPIIEDMAQAFGAEAKGGRPGNFGTVSCYSMQQGKHMTTGEGGIVTTNDPDIARRVWLFVNKAWGYGDPKPDHYFPALNFRLTELQGAVALGQLRKLDWVIERRREVAAALTEGLQGIKGLTLPSDPEGGRCSWWKYAFFVDSNVIEGGAVSLGQKMREHGVFCVPRYIQKPAFECQLFQDFNASPVSKMPFMNSDRHDQQQPLFDRKDYPGTVSALERVIVLPINELYTAEHIEYVTSVIRAQTEVLAHA